MAAITPQIGSDSRGQFLWLKGAVKPLQQVLVEIERNGINGTAYQKTGRRGEVFEMQSCVGLGDQSEVDDRLKYYVTLTSTLQTLKDGSGNSWTNVLVRHVSQEQAQSVTMAVGGTAQTLPEDASVLLICRWAFQCTIGTA